MSRVIDHAIYEELYLQKCKEIDYEVRYNYEEWVSKVLIAIQVSLNQTSFVLKQVRLSHINSMMKKVCYSTYRALELIQ